MFKIFNRINMAFAPSIKEIERRLKAFGRDVPLSDRARDVTKHD